MFLFRQMTMGVVLEMSHPVVLKTTPFQAIVVSK